MKLIDRYVISSFVRNYVISFMVLVGMYVVLDMVFNFNSMVKFDATNAGGMKSVVDALVDIADYYAYQCFLIFVQLSGIIPVVAAAFTLMRLSRFNELTALLAAGVPMLRIASPVILVAVILNGLLIIDQELLIPEMIPKIIRDHGEVHNAVRNFFPIEAMQDSKNGLVYGARYFPAPSDGPPRIIDLDVIERAPRKHRGQDRDFLVPVSHLRADEAIWNARTQQWDLTNGRRISGIMDERISTEQAVAEYKSNVTPEEIGIYRSGHFVELLPTSRINQLLDRPNMYGKTALLRVKHSRIAQPLMNVILLLLAIPCVLTREPNTLKPAAMKTLTYTGLAMGAVFLCHQFAGVVPSSLAASATGVNTWSMLMAWTPIFIFGPVSVYLLDKTKT